MPIDCAQILAQEITLLPRTDVTLNVGVTFNGKKNLYKSVRRIACNYAPSKINFFNAFMWLVYLKWIGNSYYVDFAIPSTEEEKKHQEYFT